MITVNDLSLTFGGQKLFAGANLKFIPGNCYGVIGANGAGKSTFLRILSGEQDSTSGSVEISPGQRMSVLKQDHFQYDQYSVLDTVYMGSPRLYQIMQEKETLYAKEEFTEEDGVLASQLEGEFAELGGWEAETDAARLLQGLGLGEEYHTLLMADLKGGEKVKVLLAQALFGHPDILLMDEPTNNLDAASVNWLEDFLLDFSGILIVVSHDRHFLNTVCTHTVDIDFNKVRMYVGNYDFWYESSRLMQKMLKEQAKKTDEKVKELQAFIQRFSANKSKSRQATSRRKLLDKLSVEEMPASSRRYPWVSFKPNREAGKDILEVKDLSVTVDGITLLNNITFRINKGDKVAFVGDEASATALLRVLAGELEVDSGHYKWGTTTSQSYFPKDNSAFFTNSNLSMLQWFAQFSDDESETYMRGFLGRMLFSGEEVYKSVKVLSGGEKVRCMLSRMMLSGANVLLLDQPTNHLDLESITAVNQGLCDFPGNVLFTSHDHELLQSVATRIIELTPQGMADRLTTYDEYLDWKAGH